jgi:hypothetical protein
MPVSATNTAVYRPDLGVAVLEYYEGATMGYIGQEIMPIFQTPFQSSTYPVIPQEALLDAPDVARSPRGAYNRGDWKYENGLYHTQEKGWEESVDDTERALLDRRVPGLADFIATNRAMNIILRNQEKRIAAKLFNTANFTAHAVTTEWNTVATATPISDVKDAKAAFRLQCGMLPDALVISWTTFEDLKNCDQIVNRLKYTFPGIDLNKMTSDQLAAVFDVPRVLIGGSVYNSAKKNKTAVIADFWSSEYAMLVKISSGDDFTQPGIGRTFLWTDDSPQNAIVEQYREEKIRSDVFRVRHNVDEAFMQSKDDAGSVVSNIAASCAYLFSNIHT